MSPEIQMPRRVLVVDDDDALRKLVARSLARAGFGVAEAASGAAAVDMAAADPNVVLLLDQKLPDMSGREIVTALAGRGLMVPFVMMTGQGDERLAVDMMKLGAADYLLKDVEMVDRLPGALDRVFRGIETERRLRAAEEALRESERRFRAVFQDVRSVAVQGYGADGAVRYWNRASELLYGYTAEEAMGRNLLELIVPAHLREAGARDIRKMVETGEAVPAEEMSLMRKDGTMVEIMCNYAVVRRGPRAEPEVFCLDVDLTGLRRAEADRERLTLAIEQSGEAVAIADAEGVVLYVNPAFETITGYARGEALGRHLDELRGGGPEDAQHRMMWATVKAGRAWKGEMSCFRKDGSAYTEQTTLSPVRDERGSVVHYVAVKRDVTDQVHTAAMLLQAQKMEAVGRLAGGVAHDFNNMLAVILGNVEMALEEVDETSPLHAELVEVRRAAERSADLTRQLLAFARKQTVAPKVLNLNETVEGMLKMLRRLIGENVGLKWTPGRDVGPVKMDPTQIDQILVNLCVNARDAIGDSGEIAIATDGVVLSEEACAGQAGAVPGDYVRLCVSDDGCGMDAETAAHAFEPFFTTKGVGKGTGLGLATVYGIVKQNGGFVTVYSEPGTGTVFKIYLPRQVGTTAAAPLPGRETAGASGGATILLVEDEPSILKMVKSLLERRGYSVLAAAKPAEAIHLAEQCAGEIHLLITDVIMPEMNGRDLARILLARYPGMRRLFMSGHSADVLAHHGVLDEGVHFIQKPFAMRGLQEKILAALATENGA